MDGNRRWAALHGVPLKEAYRIGGLRLRELMERCIAADIPSVTVWALSLDNLRRPSAAVRVIAEAVVAGLSQMADMARWRIRMVGELACLPAFAADELEKVERATANCPDAVLNVALAYSGRRDIATAVRELAGRDADRIGRLDGAEVEQTLGRHLALRGLPDVDLLIRTSGEHRLSGFMTWQTAYAELYFTDVLWPDFDQTQVDRALRWYAGRQRRFGE